MTGTDSTQPKPHRYGIVDIGSNAIRLTVVEVGDHSEHLVLESHRQPVRMGRDVFLTGRVQDDTVAAAVDALRRFRATCDQHGVRHIRAIATSATREARNRREIVQRIRTEAGIDVEVISGTEEAYLLGRAVQTKVDLERAAACSWTSVAAAWRSSWWSTARSSARTPIAWAPSGSCRP